MREEPKGEPIERRPDTLEPVQIDDDLPRVSIPEEVRDTLCGHARETFPEECCGLVIGEAEKRFQQVVRCKNVATQRHAEDPVLHPKDGKHAYHMDELEYARISEEAEANGARVTAIYHSHVNVAAYLSKTDLEYLVRPLFPFPDADQFVIAVHEQQVKEIGLFRREHLSERFRGFRVELGGM